MEVPDADNDAEIYSYAYLEKTLPFRAAFDRLRKPLRFPKGDNAVPVAAFGTKSFTMECRHDKILETGTNGSFSLVTPRGESEMKSSRTGAR